MPNDIISMSLTEHSALANRAIAGDKFVKFLRDEIRKVGKLLGEERTVYFAARNVEDVSQLQNVLKELNRRWDKVLPPSSVAQMSTAIPGLPAQPVDPKAQEIYDGLGVTAEAVEKYKDR